MMFIGLDSCPRATSQRLGGGSVANSLGPYSASRRVTSAASSPWSGLTPSRSAAASADVVYQETGSAGGLTSVICVLRDQGRDVADVRVRPGGRRGQCAGRTGLARLASVRFQPKSRAT